MTRASTHGMTMFHCWWLIRHGNAGVLPGLLVVLEGEDFPIRFRSLLLDCPDAVDPTERGESSACPWCHPAATSPITSLHPLELSAQHHHGPRASDHHGPRAPGHHGPTASAPFLQKMGEEQRWAQIPCNLPSRYSHAAYLSV